MSLPVLFTQADWIIWAVTAAILIYMYAARYRGYWKKQNVTEEKFGLVFGPLSRLLSKPPHERDQERYQKYGKLFGVYEGGKPTLFVGDPDLVKKVLVKDFERLPNRRQWKFYDPIMDNMMGFTTVDRWRKIRQAITPAFTSRKLRKMSGLTEDCVRVMTQHLRTAAEKSENINVKEFFGHFGLDITARCMFATELDSHTDKTHPFVSKARDVFSQDLNLRYILLFLFPGIFKLLKIKRLTSDKYDYFKSLLLSIMSQRRAQDKRTDDFLQLMMDAREGTLTDTSENGDGTENRLYELGDEVQSEQSTGTEPFSPKPAPALTEDEVLSQCISFFGAGQDTTSLAISNTVYLLALHPEVQAKLREEVDKCFEQHGRQLSLDIVSKQKYLHAVVSESLRMYPPASRVERSPTEGYVLGDTGITVTKDCVVAVPVYAMHHDPEYFPDPYTFDPDRFSDDNVSSIRPYTYLPFGAGPRNCVGMRFGLYVVKLCIMHAVHNAEFVRTPQTKVPLEFCRAALFITASDITVGVRERPVPKD